MRSINLWTRSTFIISATLEAEQSLPIVLKFHRHDHWTLPSLSLANSKALQRACERKKCCKFSNSSSPFFRRIGTKRKVVLDSNWSSCYKMNSNIWCLIPIAVSIRCLVTTRRAMYKPRLARSHHTQLVIVVLLHCLKISVPAMLITNCPFYQLQTGVAKNCKKVTLE